MSKTGLNAVIRLPDKTRKTLEKAVNELKTKDNVYGIGLFGSWSRGEAEPSSDVDLLILDRSEISDEYVERIEAGGLLIDLDHTPKKWIHSLIPPELDQKLYEMQILYDRDWSFTNTKLLMTKSYGSPDRVDIRTEAHLVDSDIYLSRATSAFSREDFRSAHLFAVVAMEYILKILAEIALEPLSNTHFLRRLEDSATKLDKLELFKEYLVTARLDKIDDSSLKEKLKLFQIIWGEFSNKAKRHPRELESVHFKVKTKLGYYLNPLFLQGTVLRAEALVGSGKSAETAHYLDNAFLDIVENYVWLKSSISKVKVDHTTLFYSLELLENKSPRTFKQMVEFFNLKDIGKIEASTTIEKARRIALDVRTDRKVLIKNHLIKS